MEAQDCMKTLPNANNKDVLIVGGGTAGWLTAALLAKTLGCGADADSVRITLLESQEIGAVGMAEASLPSLRGILQTLGIDESRLVRECGATFKQGVRFNHWVRAPGMPGADHYFHPFSLPSQRADGPELLPYWLQGAGPVGQGFAAAATLQQRVADAGRAPKRLHEADFIGQQPYAYHYDAGLFADLLAAEARALGVRHVHATLERVELAPQGAIAAVHTREAGAFTAGLYVDCSGVRAALIGDALGSPSRSVDEVLFTDRMLTAQLPYDRPDAPIPSSTIATAQAAGWICDIGLQARRSIGYVYSSRHTDDEDAERTLRAYVGPASAGLNPRQLKLHAGYRETQWIENCVAVGASAGCLEPLEASAVGLIETAASLVCHLFPHDGDMAPVARTFNLMMKARYERVVDFIKLHYCLTQRRDSAFWRDNADPASVPAALRDRLAMWRKRTPHRMDFLADLEMYSPASWQYVLYGMEYATALYANKRTLPRYDEACNEFRRITLMSHRALAELPSHRDLVDYYLGREERKLA